MRDPKSTMSTLLDLILLIESTSNGSGKPDDWRMDDGMSA